MGMGIVDWGLGIGPNRLFLIIGLFKIGAFELVRRFSLKAVHVVHNDACRV